MNEDILKQILEELRQANQFSRKISRFYSVFLVVLMIVSIVVPLGLRQLNLQKYQQHSEEKMSWRQVQSHLDQAEFEKAADITHALIKMSPNYWYGYSYLGTIYQAMGDLAKSEENYAKAYTLFPDEGNEKALKAIRKTIDKQRKSN